MNASTRIAFLLAVLVAAGLVVGLKQRNRPTTQPAQGTCCPIGATRMTQVESAPASGPAAAGVEAADVAPTATAKLPRLVDLGAGKCIPCKRMAPILEALKTECAGRVDIKFIDTWENPRAADPYRIRMIPTQIFYDAAGRELFRHEGFFGREDILAKWREFGIEPLAK